MTIQEAARIGVRGNARHVKGTTRFEVRSGTTVLRGFRTNPELRPPVAIPHLNLNREALEAFKQAATVDDLLANSKSSVILVIEQFRGRMDVNVDRLLYSLQHCLPREPLHPPPPDPREVVSVNFGTTAPLPAEITILAPGRVSTGSGGCNDYNNDVVLHTPITSVENVVVKNHLEDTTCHSEVVVYSCGSFAVDEPRIYLLRLGGRSGDRGRCRVVCDDKKLHLGDQAAFVGRVQSARRHGAYVLFCGDDRFDVVFKGHPPRF